MNGSLKTLTGAAGLLILLALLVVLNIVASPVRLRVDTTSEKLYTLSDSTKALLKDLPRDVTLKFYYSRSAEDIAPPLKQYAQRIGDLLAEYAKAGGGRLVLQTLDPLPDSDDEEWAQRYGVMGQSLDPLGDGASLYLGLVALSGSKQVVIPFFAPSDEPQIEYLVSRLIREVTTTKKPKIGVLSSLPVMGMGSSFMTPGGGTPAWVFISELRKQYVVEQLSPTLREIPADMETVMVVHPKELNPQALFALDQFVLRGGHLVAFVDPLCISEPDTQRGMPGAMDKNSDLARLTGTWGLQMDGTRLVADSAMATRVRMQNGKADRHLAWLTARAENLNRSEIATASLENMMLPMAGFFTGTPAEGLTLTPLITAGKEASSMTSFEATMGPMAGSSSVTKLDQPATIALRLSGTFKTAFPEGRPAETEPAEETPTNAPALAVSTKDGVVILVADVDMLNDEFCVQRINFPGQSLYQMANDNINFVANLFGQLTGGDQLIALRSRGSFDRPFTRVLSLQKDAQERWRQEELKLQEQLRTTQARLDEIQTSKDPSQQFILTPEQTREIEQFREQAAQTKRQLKDVRKNLRQDIEQLGVWIKGLNMAAVPGLVILFGLAHGLNRRRRSSRS